MRRSKRSRAAVVLLVSGLLALGTAGCGDDDGKDEKASPTTAATAAPLRGSDVVTIDLVDHAFQVSGPLTAGGTLQIANRGTEFHMVGLGRFKPGKTLTDLQQVLARLAQAGGGGGSTTTAPGSTTTTAPGSTSTTARGSTTTTTSRASSTTSTTAAAAGRGQQDPTAEVLDRVGLPGGFLGPNEAVEVTVPSLQPGTYALVCFFPTEGEGTPHFAKGMVGQLDVVAGAPPAPPTADVTYKVAPGKAVEGPATLTAGRHTLGFEAAPGSQQLEPGIVRLNAGATFARVNSALESLLEGTTPPAKGAASRVPGQVVFAGSDFLDVTTFYLTTDLKAGNYIIAANDSDVRTSGTPKEIINVKVA
ncbi:MAG: hypothetical protein M3326_02265 [Actinomycetota bacterium]|nr:hypothetical protein [Actinomycetota bacterium]